MSFQSLGACSSGPGKVVLSFGRQGFLKQGWEAPKVTQHYSDGKGQSWVNDPRTRSQYQPLLCVDLEQESALLPSL